MNIFDILLLAAVVCAVLAALRSLHRQRKKGSCPGDCLHCPGCGRDG